MKNFQQKNVDFTKILNKTHEGKWVALSPDQTNVLGCAATLAELRGKIKDPDAVFTKILSSDMEYAF